MPRRHKKHGWSHERQTYYCAKCGRELTYRRNTQRVWMQITKDGRMSWKLLLQKICTVCVNAVTAQHMLVIPVIKQRDVLPSTVRRWLTEEIPWSRAKGTLMATDSSSSRKSLPKPSHTLTVTQKQKNSSPA